MNANSAIHYMSVAQMQADAIAAARRNPTPRLDEPQQTVSTKRQRHISWRFVLGRV
jgi:hypothetical protein